MNYCQTFIKRVKGLIPLLFLLLSYTYAHAFSFADIVFKPASAEFIVEDKKEKTNSNQVKIQVKVDENQTSTDLNQTSTPTPTPTISFYKYDSTSDDYLEIEDTEYQKNEEVSGSFNPMTPLILEDGQELVANVTVIWNSETAEFQLNIIELILTGEMPPASTYDLSEGAPEWYALDKRTSIVGNLVTMDNQTYLQKEGGEQKIKINVKFNSVGTNSAHEGMTLKWTGRLIEVADDVTLAHHYVLDEADVTDENGNGIADDAEDS